MAMGQDLLCGLRMGTWGEVANPMGGCQTLPALTAILKDPSAKGRAGTALKAFTNKCHASQATTHGTIHSGIRIERGPLENDCSLKSSPFAGAIFFLRTPTQQASRD